MLCKDHICPTCKEEYEHELKYGEICIIIRSAFDGKKHFRKCERCMKSDKQLPLFKEGQMSL